MRRPARPLAQYGKCLLRPTSALDTFIGIVPLAPLGPETWAGLPMPEKVWDEEKG